jgi:hypothetical protein
VSTALPFHTVTPDQPIEYLSPDEIEILLEALHWYGSSKDGRKHSGRVTWIREKFVRVKLDGAIAYMNSDKA